VDVSREKVEMINAAASPVVEPGLAELLAEMVGARRLRATTSTQEAMTSTALSLICVGTPGRVNGQLDLRAIERVGREIGEALTACGEPTPSSFEARCCPESPRLFSSPPFFPEQGGLSFPPARRCES